MYGKTEVNWNTFLTCMHLDILHVFVNKSLDMAIENFDCMNPSACLNSLQAHGILKLTAKLSPSSTRRSSFPISMTSRRL